MDRLFNDLDLDHHRAAHLTQTILLEEIFSVITLFYQEVHLQIKGLCHGHKVTLFLLQVLRLIQIVLEDHLEQAILAHR